MKPMQDLVASDAEQKLKILVDKAIHNHDDVVKHSGMVRAAGKRVYDVTSSPLHAKTLVNMAGCYRLGCSCFEHHKGTPCRVLAHGPDFMKRPEATFHLLSSLAYPDWLGTSSIRLMTFIRTAPHDELEPFQQT
ncbi:hypothetical protein M378DRAFT_12984 [Amanita muscaria Koide BX008]|uniref:Uncharacterized protein n=1 Tax=Amanita muscaria (strain Koide BX008) TaxID=946122 RepID=A0A0C2SGN6_AMAMK|nr:hypothetical protein M378DRAFT_12984 [Amanita muscaria Koide BX008]